MKRTTVLLGVLGVLLVGVVWFLLVVSPKRTELSDLDDEIRAAQIEAQGLRGEKAALLAIRDSELTYRRAAAELERSIPQAPELAQFIEDANLLAAETGVVLNTLNPNPPQVIEGQLFMTLDVSFAMQGQFFEILGFLFGLEDMERLVKVDSLNLLSAEDEDGNLVLNGVMIARIFTLALDLPTPQAVPAPEGEGQAPQEQQQDPAAQAEEQPAEEEQAAEAPGTIPSADEDGGA